MSHTRPAAPASQVDRPRRVPHSARSSRVPGGPSTPCPHSARSSRVPGGPSTPYRSTPTPGRPETRAQGGQGQLKLLPRALRWTEGLDTWLHACSEPTPRLRTRAQGRPRWAPRPARGPHGLSRAEPGPGEWSTSSAVTRATTQPSPCAPGGQEEKPTQTRVLKGHNPTPITSLTSHRRKADELTP